MMPLCWAAVGRGEGGGAGQNACGEARVVRPGCQGMGGGVEGDQWRTGCGGEGGKEWDNSRLLNYLLFLSDNK